MEHNNMSRIEQMKKLVDEMEWVYIGDVQEAVDKLYEEEKERLMWSGVYPISVIRDDGSAIFCEDPIFEGPAVDCANYVIDHPELRGKCIISRA